MNAPHRPRVWRGWLLVFFSAGVVLLAPAGVAAQALDDQAREIAKQLRCPICESVSVADSPAELAVQMRAVIRRKLEAGESRQQIIDYFVGAYGDSVLLEPPLRGLGWLVWAGPVVALALGSAVLWMFLRVWVRGATVREKTASRLGPSDDSMCSVARGLVPRPSPALDESHLSDARRELDVTRGRPKG